jgi:hypothetical protein
MRTWAVAIGITITAIAATPIAIADRCESNDIFGAPRERGALDARATVGASESNPPATESASESNPPATESASESNPPATESASESNPPATESASEIRTASGTEIDPPESAGCAVRPGVGALTSLGMSILALGLAARRR